MSYHGSPVVVRVISPAHEYTVTFFTENPCSGVCSVFVRLCPLFHMHADTPIWRWVGRLHQFLWHKFRVSPTPETSSHAKFDIFAYATGCTDDSQKCMLRDAQTIGKAHAVTAHCRCMQEVFATLADTGVTYDEVVTALNAHFQPQVDVTFQRRFPPQVDITFQRRFPPQVSEISWNGFTTRGRAKKTITAVWVWCSDSFRLWSGS